MKKLLAFLGAIITLFLISSVMASGSSFNLKLAQKDPSTWITVKKGGTGNVLLSHGDRASAVIRKMEPKTEYTLVYYGFEGNNDVWPYATCITSGKTNKNGAGALKRAVFNYKGFIDDGKNQKFWVVLSSDVDCVNHRMVAWNPTEYLFEQRVI